jgi:dienelactone hydrolase
VEHYHVHAVLADLCGYGASYCPDPTFEGDQLAQVRALARETTSKGRFVLVGASMGGALALAATARTGADALVDLSGPPDYPGASATAAAPSVSVPTLIVVSHGDPSANYGQLHSAFARIPAAHKKFVTGNGQHGWNMLTLTGTAPFTPLARTVADWIVGRYRD